MNDTTKLATLDEKEGLSIRDQFAIAALPGLIEKYGKISVISKWAYEVADDMLNARKQEENRYANQIQPIPA